MLTAQNYRFGAAAEQAPPRFASARTAGNAPDRSRPRQASRQSENRGRRLTADDLVTAEEIGASGVFAGVVEAALAVRETPS